MVRVRELEKHFGDLRAVNGVSFEVERGTCFGLLGPNGAGKSTTISMIVGTQSPDKGTIEIDGSEIKSETDPLRRKIGYVPQDLALFEDLNCIQNLSFFASLYNLSKGEATTKTHEVLEIVGLADRSNDPIKEFSGGMKRRLNIAIALIQSPELLVLDEPTVGVDPQSRNAIFEVLEHLKANGMTLIYTSHYMEEIERMCDQISIIDNGKVILCGTLEHLLATLPSRYRLRFSFLDDQIASQAEKALESSNIGKVFRTDATVEVLPESNAQAIVDSVNLLQEAGMTFDDLNVERGTLEEVFLQSTGKSLRD
jgi:ABC-2 type transport system ATP-binding protein